MALTSTTFYKNAGGHGGGAYLGGAPASRSSVLECGFSQNSALGGVDEGVHNWFLLQKGSLLSHGAAMSCNQRARGCSAMCIRNRASLVFRCRRLAAACDVLSVRSLAALQRAAGATCARMVVRLAQPGWPQGASRSENAVRLLDRRRRRAAGWTWPAAGGADDLLVQES